MTGKTVIIFPGFRGVLGTLNTTGDTVIDLHKANKFFKGSQDV